MLRGALTLALALTVLAAGCGDSTDSATIAVSVSDLGGSPIPGAQVRIVGTDFSGTTDATGNVHFEGVKSSGVFTVEAGTEGYFRDDAQVTVTAEGDPPPVAIALRYAPPIGNFVYQPKSTLWYVLSIESLDPWTVQLHQMEWGCWSHNWTQAAEAVQLESSQNALRFGYGRTIPIVAPDQLGTAWEEDPNESLMPNTSPGVVPPGACNGSEAAWDSGNG